MKLQIKVNDDGVIEDAKFKTFGCGSAIASSSLATEWLKGKTVDEALAIKNTEIVEELSLPPVKIHCSVLAEDAIKAAIKDWKDARPRRATRPRAIRRRPEAGSADENQQRKDRRAVAAAGITLTENAVQKILALVADDQRERERAARQGRGRRVLGPLVQDGPRPEARRRPASSSATARASSSTARASCI